MSFGSYIKGFKYYSIADLYLYEGYEGKLLIAIIFYATNEIFYLSFIIVDKENNYNWRWFLLCLLRYVNCDKTNICIITSEFTISMNR